MLILNGRKEHIGPFLFDPERRAASDQRDYVNSMNSLRDELYEIAETEQQRKTANEQLQQYKEGYLNKLYAWLDAKSRTMSSMITGPANFPTAKNEKANRTANKRMNEFMEWEEKARKKSRTGS